MCKCCGSCCDRFLAQFTCRELSEREEFIRRKNCKKLLWPLASYLSILMTIESILWTAMYGGCLALFAKPYFFSTLPFGDCNGPKLYHSVVILFLILQTALGVCCIIGFKRKSWKLIVPFLSLRGVLITFFFMTCFFDSEGLNGFELTFDLMTSLTLAFNWIPLMLAYLHIYRDTEPIEKEVDYDET